MAESKGGGPDELVELADAVLRVARKLRADPLHHSDVVPLTPLECLVLLHVHRHPGASPSDLAAELALRPSNTSTALRGLVAKGQVTRMADPSDARAARLHVTPEAEHSIASVRRRWHELLGPAGLPEADLRAALRVLTSIDATLAEPGTVRARA